jgi:hypothetical protein
LKCNEIVSLRYNTLQQGETQGCRKCSKVIVDGEEAFRFFESRDLVPLERYPGSNVPWRSIHRICGQVISPRYGHIKSGRLGCPHCSKKVPITQAAAFKLFEEAGLRPLEEFQSPHTPWRSIHILCGKEVSPRYANIQQGHGACKFCTGKMVDPAMALQVFREAGLEPLEPFVDSKTAWKSKHLACGRTVSPAYGSVQSGQGGCRYCGARYIDPEEARSELVKLGFEPLEEYRPQQKWLVRHVTCGRTIRINYSYTKKTGGGCNYCAGLAPISEDQAIALFENAGFSLVDRFMKASEKVRAVHNACGREVEVLYGSIRNGVGCRFCQVGAINLDKPGFIYLIHNELLMANKIGIGGCESKTNRIDQHRKAGWVLYKRMELNTASRAFSVEQEVLRWLRNDLSLPPFVSAEEMRQGGHTETFDASEIALSTVWDYVCQVVELVDA